MARRLEGRRVLLTGVSRGDRIAEGALAVTTMPFAITRKFWKDGREIPF
jgi:hypothetical protein